MTMRVPFSPNSIFLSLLVTAAVQLGHAQNFVQIGNSLPPIHYGAVDWGDFDNDGDLDLLIAGNTPSAALSRIYRNDGSAVFTDIQATLPPMVALGGSAIWGDFDGDGDLDFFLGGGDGTDIFRNDGNGVFRPMNAGLPRAQTCSAAWGDFDNDGDLDLYASGQNAYGSAVGGLYRNDGNQGFRFVTTAIPPAPYGSACWGDFDNDGDLDLVMTGLSSQGAICRVYRNNGGGQFTDILAGLPYTSDGTAAWGDFDNDGYADILLCGSPTAGTRVYRNDRNGHFAPLPASFVEVYNSWAAWGDFDNDGFLDFVVQGARNGRPTVLLAYHNEGNTFSSNNFAGSGLHAGQIAWGDYDVDGRLDVIATGLNDSGVRYTRLMRNVGAKRNTAPTAPAGLHAASRGTGVKLTWTAGADPDQNGGLTYNVRVGRSPGAGDVMTAHSTTSGLRLLARFGNAGQSLGWRLTNLAAGTYYWSVQTVDSAFAGSAFAPQQTFVVRPANSAPVADATGTIPLVISVNNSNATVVLNGSRSTDADGDPLEYVWTFPGTALPGATGIVSVVTLPLGTYTVTLRVNDGVEESEQNIVVEIITASEAVTRLIAVVNAEVEQKQALLASLSAALRAIDRSNPNAAISQLEAFQNKVRSQVAPLDPELATTLDQEAQAIIDALKQPGGPGPIKISGIDRTGNGRLRVGFMAERGPIYVIEASTNLITWERIGVAAERDGNFEFVDPGNSLPKNRFYRVIAP
jgi:hypothetical protein